MSVIVTLPGGAYLPSGRPNTKRSDPTDPRQLAEPLGTRVRAMIADCPHRGELGLVSGFRDPGRQWDLRAQRVGAKLAYTSPPTGRPVTGVPARWNGSAWVGGSRHQHGEAADFGGTIRAMEWMRANRERYGLALTVPSEGWHVEANKRDVRTGRVHNTAPAITRPLPPASPPPNLRRGSKGDAVRFLQVMLNKARRFTKHPEIAVDGDFGPATEAAVKATQKWSNDFLDAIGDRTTSRVVVHGIVGPGTSEVILAWATA